MFGIDIHNSLTYEESSSMHRQLTHGKHLRDIIKWLIGMLVLFSLCQDLKLGHLNSLTVNLKAEPPNLPIHLHI